MQKDASKGVPGDWQPSCTLEALQCRAQLLAQIRAFFSNRDVLEVQTPVLARHTVTDPNIDSFLTQSGGLDLYLQTSPEFFMKRLLAAGAPSIYQIAPAFRVSEIGRQHNHEFTMLEWYRRGFSLSELMQEVAELIDQMLGAQKFEYLSVAAMFASYFGLDPHTAGRDENIDACLSKGAEPKLLADLNDLELFDWMYSEVQQTLTKRVFVSDFPVQHAALARIERNASGVDVARRFELIVDGIELANGYLELLDARELEARMQADIQYREIQNKCLPEADTRLLNSMIHGLPNCSGVAMGLDRVLMIKQHASTLSEIISFAYDSC